MAKKKSSTRTRKSRSRRPKNQPLPGLEQARHADLNKAAEVYVEQRDGRMEALQVEIEARDKLVQKMREHGLTTYRDPDSDILVELVEGKTKVRVKRAADEEEDEAELVSA